MAAASPRPGWKHACFSDAAWASFRSPVGPAGACHSLGYGAAQGTCSFRLLARRVARVVHAEAARVRPEAVPHRSAVPGRRVGFRTDRRRYGSSFTVVRRWAGHASGFGQGELCALCTPRPLGCAPRPSHTPALALAAASLVCTSARRSLQAKWVLTGGMVAAHVVASQTRGVRTDGCRGTQISTHEHRVGGGATRIASDRRWPPWPPWPPLGSDPQNIFSSWSVGVLTSGHYVVLFFIKLFS